MPFLIFALTHKTHGAAQKYLGKKILALHLKKNNKKSVVCFNVVSFVEKCDAFSRTGIENRDGDWFC